MKNVRIVISQHQWFYEQEIPYITGKFMLSLFVWHVKMLFEDLGLTNGYLNHAVKFRPTNMLI